MLLPDLKQQFRQLIQIPTVSSTQQQLDQSNQAVIELLAHWLTELKFNCHIQPVAQGKYNLIARYGEGDGGLILSGHTDTVPYDESLWATNPLELYEANDRWYGLGSCDMKGFFAMAIEAIKAVQDNPFKHPLTLIATCDEESSMNGARTLDNKYPLAQAIIIGEPTNLQPIRLHKGILMERIELLGQSGHSSDPNLGHNALEAMNEVITSLIQLRTQWQQQYQNALFTTPYATLNLGRIYGGDNPNRICGHCCLDFDLRPLPSMESDHLQTEIKQRIQAIADQHHVALNYSSLFPHIPAFEQKANSTLVQLAEKLTNKRSAAVSFATEAPFIHTLAQDTIILGAGSIDQAHQPNEYVSLSQVNAYIKLLKQFIAYYCL